MSKKDDYFLYFVFCVLVSFTTYMCLMYVAIPIWEELSHGLYTKKSLEESIVSKTGLSITILLSILFIFGAVKTSFEEMLLILTWVIIIQVGCMIIFGIKYLDIYLPILFTTMIAVSFNILSFLRKYYNLRNTVALTTLITLLIAMALKFIFPAIKSFFQSTIGAMAFGILLVILIIASCFLKLHQEIKNETYIIQDDWPWKNQPQQFIKVPLLKQNPSSKISNQEKAPSWIHRRYKKNPIERLEGFRAVRFRHIIKKGKWQIDFIQNGTLPQIQDGYICQIGTFLYEKSTGAPDENEQWVYFSLYGPENFFRADEYVKPNTPENPEYAYEYIDTIS